MSDQRTALVLGGGGITGIAWEIGLVAGLADAGRRPVRRRPRRRHLGGSVVAARLRPAARPGEMYARQLEPATGEKAARLNRATLAQFGWAMLRSRGRDVEFRRRIGALALAAEKAGLTPPEQERLDVFGARPGRHGVAGAGPDDHRRRRGDRRVPHVRPRLRRAARLGRGRELRRPRRLPAGDHRRTPVRRRRHAVGGQRRPRPGLRPARRAGADPARASGRWPASTPRSPAWSAASPSSPRTRTAGRRSAATCSIPPPGHPRRRQGGRRRRRSPSGSPRSGTADSAAPRETIMKSGGDTPARTGVSLPNFMIAGERRRQRRSQSQMPTPANQNAHQVGDGPADRRQQQPEREDGADDDQRPRRAGRCAAIATAIRKPAPNHAAIGWATFISSSAASAAVGLTPPSSTRVPTATAAPGAAKDSGHQQQVDRRRATGISRTAAAVAGRGRAGRRASRRRRWRAARRSPTSSAAGWADEPASAAAASAGVSDPAHAGRRR